MPLQKYYDYFNVLDYGASGDDVTDDTDAIQNAIEDAGSGDQRGIVWFPSTPSNSYRVRGLRLTSREVHLKGSQQRSTTIKYLAGTPAPTSIAVVECNNTAFRTGIVIEDLRISANASTTFDCLYLNNLDLFHLNRVGFASGKWGLNLDNARIGTISNCIFGSGLQVGLRAQAGGGRNTIEGCWFNENTDKGLYINGIGNVVVGCRFEDNTGEHLFLDAGGAHNVIVANHFAGGANIGIQIYGDDNFIDGNVMSVNLAGQEIALAVGADRNIIGINYLLGGGTIHDLGANNKIIGTINASRNIRLDFTTQTTVGAAGGASALPATPTGYIILDIGGSEYVIPFYNKA